MKRHFRLERPLLRKPSIVTFNPPINCSALRTISQDVGINNLLCPFKYLVGNQFHKGSIKLKSKRIDKKMEPVWLYVYDLSEGIVPAVTAYMGVSVVPGIWHSSIVVHNKEIEFGRNGINCTHVGFSDFTLVHKYYLGETTVSLKDLENYLRFLNSTMFKPENYNVVTFNCNVFANFLANQLVHKNIPEYLLQIPKVCISSGLQLIYKAATRMYQSNFFRF